MHKWALASCGFLAIFFLVACYPEPIPQGTHAYGTNTVEELPERVLRETTWIRRDARGDEAYRLSFDARGFFDIFYYRHRRPLLWGSALQLQQRVRMRYLGGDIPSACRVDGIYTMMLRNNTLLLTAADDSCASRRALLQFEWERVR